MSLSVKNAAFFYVLTCALTHILPCALTLFPQESFFLC